MSINEHIYSYTVQETDLDFLGHVNNATYVKLYEQARWQLTHDRGYSLKKILELGQSPIILEINVKYLKELKARNNIEIKTKLIEYSGKTGKLQQTMHSSEVEAIFSDAIITFGLFDMKTRKLINPTPEWLAILSS